MFLRTNNQGFSLIELLVVMAIIGILSSVLYFSFSDTRAQARDAERQTDLRLLQSAIELYKNRNGVYPEGCNGPNSWSGQVGTDYECSSGTQYILDLAPEFIPTLPTDPRLNGGNSGYVYTVNGDRTVYKLMAKNTVESEIVTFDHELKSCDVDDTVLERICDTVTVSGSPAPAPTHCRADNSQFQTSYGVWGGFADGSSDAAIMRNTEAVICQIQ